MLLVLSRDGATIALLGVLTILGWALLERLHRYSWRSMGGLYTLVVSGYVLSRFTLAALYRTPEDTGIQPTVAIIVPAFNEGRAIVETIEACCGVQYPVDKLEIVCVNDGSSDDTWARMVAAASRSRRAFQCIDLPENRGKRAALATGIRATGAEILVFVDSDSAPDPPAVGRIVQAFSDPRVGAVSGITYVRNAGDNLLTRIQAARYFISYALLKAAESVVGAVTCCSGCFAAYRRDAVLPVLEAWEHQRFLGAACTYGDDRSLTNQILRTGWRTRYHARAESWTKVPDEYATFFRQQLRWKKSWLREGLLLMGHIWRTRPIALPSIGIAALTGLLSPLILFWNFCWMPGHQGIFPVVYAMALYLVAMAYSLYYRSARKDGLWLYACLGTLFYLAFSAQLLWALARVRDGSWGTRRV